jgi:hypothetical protein
MKHSRFGLILLLAAAGGWACNADPTESLRETNTRIITDPAVILLPQGASILVTAQLVDEQGSQLAADFDFSNVGSGITVARDSTFLETTNGAKITTTERFVVTAVDPVSTTFTLTAGGQTQDVPVKVVANTLAAASFSNQAPALGDTVTLTLPPNLKFTADAAIFFPGAAGNPVVTGFSADSTVMSFLPAPGTDTTGFVSGVFLAYAPDVPLDTLETTGLKLTTPVITEIPANFSPASAAPNQAITVTAPGFKFLPDLTVSFANGSGIVTSVAADSNSATFIADPGASGAATLGNVSLDILPVPLTLTSINTVTVSTTVPSISGTSPATAPTITIPAEGASSAFYDAGTFTGADLTGDAATAQYYKFVIAESGDYTFTVDWENPGADLDPALCVDVDCSDGGDFLSASGTFTDKPETDVRTLEPGTYYLDLPLFSGTAPAWVSIKIDHAPPSE